MSRLLAVNPVIAVRDVRRAARWYCNMLGFEPRFVDDDEAPRYGAVGRDGVELHFQWHGPDEWASGLTTSMYRFLIDDPGTLFGELAGRGAIPRGRQITVTAWGTREFGLHDPDGNTLVFYRNVR